MAAAKPTGATPGEAGPNAGGQAMLALTRGRAAWSAMTPGRRNRLMAAGALLLAVMAGVAWWSGRTDWKTLYSGLDGRDLQQVQSELAGAGISYQSTPDGLGVQVPAELLDKARMEVAAKGMPQSGRMGFELFDKPNWVGSEFDEKVNYQRALEGELENTIATLGTVRSARVHLVLPKESLFTAEQQPAKASVVLKLKRATLEREQVESIRGLVAAAVEGLSPEQVTLVDADGRANLNTPDASGATRDEEQALENKVIALLEPLAGHDNVRATVNITYDTSTQERTDEVVDPTQVVALTSQKSEQTSGANNRPGGIPGTVSNAPAPAASGTAQAAVQAGANDKSQLPVYPTAGGQNQTAHEENSTFAVSRHLLHQQIGPGRIARVTAAVLVNDRSVEGGTVKAPTTIWKPRSADEMKRLEELAQAAVGYDTKRGDQVTMENISFSNNAPAAPPATGMTHVTEEAQSLLRAQPELLRTVGAGVLGVLFILAVVRPVARQAVTLLREAPELSAPASAHVLGATTERDRLTLAQNGGEAGMASALADGRQDDGTNALPTSARPRSRRLAAIDSEGVLEYVAEHVRREPNQSTRLLEAWIGTTEDRA